uniref:Uncharacterized protein n=1 Tax=Arundo donax TaxID=35708 RepID=A0A0A9B4G4_ARUDO
MDHTSVKKVGLIVNGYKSGHSRAERGREMVILACYVDNYTLIRVIWTLNSILSKCRDLNMYLESLEN